MEAPLYELIIIYSLFGLVTLLLIKNVIMFIRTELRYKKLMKRGSKDEFI